MSVQFSMIFEVQLATPTPEEERRVYHETVEQALLGEQVGFDSADGQPARTRPSAFLFCCRSRRASPAWRIFSIPAASTRA